MALTDTQKAALKAHINTNTNTIVVGGVSMQIKDVPNTGDTNPDIAAWYNQLASPAFYAWYFTRTRMDNRRAILNTVGAGSQLDNLTAGKRDALLWCLDDTVEPKLSAVRTTIDDLTGSQNTLKAAILDGFKKQLTYTQKVMSTGTGSFASPADGTYEGTLTGQDVTDARNS
jgi:hypothetical protein